MLGPLPPAAPRASSPLLLAADRDLAASKPPGPACGDNGDESKASLPPRLLRGPRSAPLIKERRSTSPNEEREEERGERSQPHGVFQLQLVTFCFTKNCTSLFVFHRPPRSSLIDTGTMAGAPSSQAIALAASAIADCDFLLVAAGAGFSADSGLPVYSDVAKLPAYAARGLDYADLARPSLLDTGDRTDASLFYGFWSMCAQQYDGCVPHDGYGIICRWMDRKDGFVYTSNVDGHFARTGCPPDKLYELHGNCHEWQCVKQGCCGGLKFRVPDGHKVSIDSTTCLAALSSSRRPGDVYLDELSPLVVASSSPPSSLPPSSPPPPSSSSSGSAKRVADEARKAASPAGESTQDRFGRRGGDGERSEGVRVDTEAASGTRLHEDGGAHPASSPPSVSQPSVLRCPSCGGPPRPAVLMFEDEAWCGNAAAEERYVAWEEAMEAAIEADESKRVVILEMGCGLRVPCVRQETELVLVDTLNRAAAASNTTTTTTTTTSTGPRRAQQALLIRVNLNAADLELPPAWTTAASEGEREGEEEEGKEEGGEEGGEAAAAAKLVAKREDLLRSHYLGIQGKAVDVLRAIDRAIIARQCRASQRN